MKIGIILGSTRPDRFGDQPTKWVMDIAKTMPEATFELIDLVDMHLPLLDEPHPPLKGIHTKDHSLAWKQLVASLDGFVIVTPEYNHSVPAALKNAIDFLAEEWNYKPVAFVSYGGGAGGSRAVEPLRSVAGYLNMFDISEHVAIVDYWHHLNANGVWQPTDAQNAAATKMLEAIIFWTKHMQSARKALQG